MHWGCATPRLHPDLELPILDGSYYGARDPKNIKEWDRLYTKAESLLSTTDEAFNESIRHTLVLETLQKEYHSIGVPLPKWPKVRTEGQPRSFGPIPLACHRMPNKDYVFWHAADTISRGIFEDPEKRERLTLLTNTACQYLELDTDANNGKTVTTAKCVNYLADISRKDATQSITAKFFVVAAGAIGTPQVGDFFLSLFF